jgi:GxxExxY protein
MEKYKTLTQGINDLSGQIVDAAYKVHSTLGPGLLESVYEVCLCYELSKRNIGFIKQMSIPVKYDGVQLGTGFRIDILVETQIIIELKAVKELTPLHDAQLLTYLKLTGKRLGLLINFNSTLIKNGIKRKIL